VAVEARERAAAAASAAAIASADLNSATAAADWLSSAELASLGQSDADLDSTVQAEAAPEEKVRRLQELQVALSTARAREKEAQDASRALGAAVDEVARMRQKLQQGESAEDEWMIRSALSAAGERLRAASRTALVAKVHPES
jgi:type VI protein secretion system component VasF